MTQIEPQRAPADGAAILEARGICKAFAGIAANMAVDFTLRRGEIHALLGENGAGKSTLASILTGLYHPDSGEILLHGKPVRFRHPGDALAGRIGVVHQHFHLVESFTAAENVLLGHPDQGFFARRGQSRSVASLGERFGLAIRPDTRIAELSMGERQRVEIVKLLYRDVEILFLDEPTAVLAPHEVEALFATLRSMAATGKSIVLITHKLEEVMAIARRATIMRQGRVVKTVLTAETSVEELARSMVGHDIGAPPPRRGNSQGGPVIVAEKLRLPNWANAARTGIDFTVNAGEILGVAGVAGNGQLQLAETLAGLAQPQSGRVAVNGIDIVGKGSRTARKAGLAYVPQDRLGTGLARGLSIADNLRLTRQLPFLLSNRRSEAQAAGAIREFNIKARGPREKSGSLSGGNVQKVLLARELGMGTNALVIASPTRGLDVAATEFVRNLIDQHRRQGAAILLISEDLDEICMLADRIVVMYAGGLVLECSAAESQRTELGLAMAGAAPRPAC